VNVKDSIRKMVFITLFSFFFNLSFIFSLSRRFNPQTFHLLASNSKSTYILDNKAKNILKKIFHTDHNRHEIAFYVNVVGQWMRSPYREDSEATYWILRYLKINLRKDLYFKENNKQCSFYLYICRLSKDNISITWCFPSMSRMNLLWVLISYVKITTPLLLFSLKYKSFLSIHWKECSIDIYLRFKCIYILY